MSEQDDRTDELETVDPQDTLISAIEAMFKNEYTRLGVEGDREVVGRVSYRSISRVLSLLRKLGIDEELPTRQVGIAIEEIASYEDAIVGA